MRKNICILLFFLINISISANDGRVVIGPSIEILDNENTNVIMQSEVINITIHDEYYEITVEFDFYNEGSDETVLIGFPVESWGFINHDDYIYENISDFMSYINGELISEYIIKEEEYKEMYFIIKKKWYIREILFPEKSHTYSRVTYRVKNQYYLDDFGTAGYIFGTGRSWKDNKIGKMTVYITHDDNIIILEINYLDAFDFTWEANGIYKFEIENIEPEINDRIYIVIQRSDNFFNSRHRYNNKISLLYKDENDIQYYTINQIRLLINSHFTNHEYELDSVDIKNINNLIRLEKMIPKNSQENYIKLLHEIEILESFSEIKDIKQENIMGINDEGIYSGIIQNNTEKKSTSIWIIFMIFGGGILMVCLLFYVIKRLKYK
jgi:hypothetical protein